MGTEPLDRQVAIELGLKKYLSKDPCKNNHINVERYSRSGNCVECAREYSTKYRLDNREYLKNKTKKYREYNKEVLNKKSLEWSRLNRESRAAYLKEYYRLNRTHLLSKSLEYSESRRIEKAKYDKMYREINVAKLSAVSSWKRAVKKQRTVSWANKKEITKFYVLSRKLSIETGIEHHVDHIIPLLGKLVSGLHVENNLRVIPAKENMQKRNTLVESLL